MYRTTEQHDPIAQLYRSLNAQDTASAVSVIMKLRGETCDIDCLYCYEKRKVDLRMVHPWSPVPAQTSAR